MTIFCITGCRENDLTILRAMFHETYFNNSQEPSFFSNTVDSHLALDIDSYINHSMTVAGGRGFLGWISIDCLQFLDKFNSSKRINHFIFAISSPLRVLAKALSAGIKNDDIPMLLNEWGCNVTRMYNFYFNNPESVKVISLDSCIEDKTLFLKWINKNYDLAINENCIFDTVEEIDSLSMFFSYLILKNYPEQVDLYKKVSPLFDGPVGHSKLDAYYDDDNFNNYYKILMSTHVNENLSVSHFFAQEKNLLLQQIAELQSDLRYLYINFCQHKNARIVAPATEVIDLVHQDHNNKILTFIFKNKECSFSGIKKIKISISVRDHFYYFSVDDIVESSQENDQTTNNCCFTRLFVNKNKFLLTKEYLLQATTTDWVLLRNILSEFQAFIDSELSFSKFERQWRFELSSFVRKAEEYVRSFSSNFRYDSAAIFQSTVNEDYECLTLHLHNIIFNNKIRRIFEFRLSCANTNTKFGVFPKIEFPERNCKNFFDSWFAESSDDRGDKIEIRFALPNAMDNDVFLKFSETDQHFISQLIVCLPKIIYDISQSSIRISRPWNDWNLLAYSVCQVFMKQFNRL
jgi:hypothetical protein